MAEQLTARQEWQRGWPVAGASLAGFTLISFYTFSFGAFIAPIEKAFGWSRAEISLGLTVITVTAGLLTPFLGLLVDRWGPRRVAIPGALSYALTYGILGLTSDNVWVWWGLWFILSFTIIGIKPLVWTTAVASTFRTSRGLALAFALCGGGLSSALAPSYSAWTIATFGWRLAYPFLGLSMGLMVLPILWLGLHSGADRPRSGEANEASAGDGAALYGMGAREAMLSVQFVKLSIAAFVFTVAAIGIVPNLLPILSSFGFARTEAAAIAGVAGITSIIGRLVTGALLDRLNANLVSGAVVLVPVASCLLLLWAPGNAAIAIVAVGIIGLALGSEVDVMAFLTARQFGTANYGVIFGVISGLWAIATGTGPTLVNWVYDMTGGYELALRAAIPLFVLTAVLLFTLGSAPEFSRDERAAGPAMTKG